MEKEYKNFRAGVLEPLVIDGKVERENTFFIDLATYDDTDLWVRVVFKASEEQQDIVYYEVTDIISYGPRFHLTFYQEIWFYFRENDFFKFIEENGDEVLKGLRKYILHAIEAANDIVKDISRLLEEE